jgi:catechol 2,3-dioxygenase-like lactoylglutathione lyase family enzyme
MDLAVDIGGLFIYSSDPQRLAEWYREHLGIEYQYSEFGYYHEFLHQDPIGAGATRTVWAILPRKSPSSGNDHSFEVNYRVGDLKKTIGHLQSRSVNIERSEEYDYCHFAWIRDPEGNRIELFQDMLLSKPTAA